MKEKAAETITTEKERPKEGQREQQKEQSFEGIRWYRTNYFYVGLTAFITFVCCILVFFVLLRFEGFAGGWKTMLRAGQSIVIGLILAYLLNPVMCTFEKLAHRFLDKRMRSARKARKLSRGFGVVMAVLILILILALLIAMIIPSLINSIASLVDTLPAQVTSLVNTIRHGNFGDSEAAQYISRVLTNATDYIENWAETKLLPQAQTYVTQITSGVISVAKTLANFVIGIIVAVYVLSAKETFAGQSKKVIYAVFRPKWGNLLIEIVRETNRIFGGFITGKILDSAIIGMLCYIGCSILRIPDALLVSAIVGVTNIIPFFGPIIGAVPCLFLVVVQSPIHALYLLIFVVVLQQVDGNIIGPKILGDSTGLSSFWVMFAILIGGGLFGFPGMLFGVPVMGVIYYLMRRVVNYGVRRRGLSEDTVDYIRAESVDVASNVLVQLPKETAPKEASPKEETEEE